MNKDFKNRIVKAINKGILEALQLTLDDEDFEDNDIIRVDKNFDPDKDAYTIELQIRMNNAVENKDWETVKNLYKDIQVQYTVKTKEELEQIIEDYIKYDGNKCDLNWINTGLITDKSELFSIAEDFNGHI